MKRATHGGALRATGLAGLLFTGLAAIGFVYQAFGPAFLAGHAGYWQSDTTDIAQYLAGFHQFFNAPWKLPLLALDSLNYPVGTRATFVDIIPAYALLLKLLVPASAAPFNPFGYWVGLCFVLQAVSAWWISRELEADSWPFLVALTTCLLLSPALLARIGHISLMSHWLVLFALALCIRGHRRQTLPVLGWSALLVAAFHINIYLFVMALALYLAAVLGSIRQKSGAKPWRLLVPFALVLASLLPTLLPLPPSEITREWGFGYYSMNLLSPLVGGQLIQVQASVGEGQYEGFNYLGLGILLALVLAWRLQRQHDPEFFTRHRALTLLMLLFAAYALSNQIYFGSTRLLVIQYPHLLDNLTAQFRASGRFFWPVGYGVVIFSLYMLYRWLPTKTFFIAMAAIIVLQGADIKGQYRALQKTLHAEPVVRIQPEQWQAALPPAIRTLYFYPKFKCGTKPLNDSLLPVMRYAAMHQLNLNTGYIARYTPPCDDIAVEVAQSDAQWSAYLFVRSEFPTLQDIDKRLNPENTLHCKPLDFVWLCTKTS